MKRTVTDMGGRSMRTIHSSYIFSKVAIGYENESMINVHLHELASKSPPVVSSSFDHEHDLSVDFSTFAYMSDISGELQVLQFLANLNDPQQQQVHTTNNEEDDEPGEGFLKRENFSTEDNRKHFSRGLAASR